MSPPPGGSSTWSIGRATSCLGCGNLFRHRVDRRLIEQMTNGADHLFDAKRQTTSTTSFSQPNWFVIYAVSDARFRR